MSISEARSTLRAAVDGFTVEVPAPKLGLGYRLGLLAAATLVVMLPLVYRRWS